jgi:hypothetical protein
MTKISKNGLSLVNPKEFSSWMKVSEGS